jgi:type II secretory pathway pseudopilin PulG
VSQRSNDYCAPTVDCNALNARQRAQRSRARAGGTPDSLQDLSDAPPDRQAGPHVRAPTVRTQRPGDVVGAPDSVRWRTRLSGAPCDNSLHQTASLVVGVINTPNHPSFKTSKFSTFQLLTRALAFNSRHTQVIKSSPNSTKALVLSERDLLVFFRALALGLLPSFILSCDHLICKQGKRHQLCGGPCGKFDSQLI